MLHSCDYFESDGGKNFETKLLQFYLISYLIRAIFFENDFNRFKQDDNVIK